MDYIITVLPGHEKESVMRPTVSVCRKGNDLYLTLEGDYSDISSQELLQALRKLVVTSLKCFATDSPVVFSFKTHGKVNTAQKLAV
jgi:hypothetical protein